MKRSYKKVLDGVRQFSPLLSFAEQGMSPAEIKQSIIDLLSPYFTNQSVLNDLAIEVLVPEAVNVSKIENDAWAKVMFTNVLSEYRQAMSSDKNACFEGSAKWESKIQHGVSEYWSGFHLEIDKSELPLEEFKYEAFRNIGMVIEASLQPLLKELLLQVRIRRGKANPETGLDTLDLGVAVGELFDTSGYPELFAPPPWGIRLNQWRNMAQHHKSRVENDMIIGIYGKGSNEREVRFKRDELFDALKRIYMIFTVIKTARSIFLVDNIGEYKLKLKDVELRADAKILHLASSVATQGFELIDISIEEKSVTAVVKDVTDSTVKERMLHASQFVYPVWRHFPADEIIVQYLDAQGDLILTTIGKGSDCDEVGRKVVPFEELANRVTFTLSEKGKSYFAEAAT
jgi:ribosomal protein L25 (general stress protein Ctc)